MTPAAAYQLVQRTYAQMDAISNQLLAASNALKQITDADQLSTWIHEQQDLDAQWQRAYHAYVEACAQYAQSSTLASGTRGPP